MYNLSKKKYNEYMSLIPRVLFFFLLGTHVFGQTATGYWNDFSTNSATNWVATNTSMFTLAPGNGEMKIQVACSGYANLQHMFGQLNISANPKIKLNVKAGSNFTLRIDMMDVNGVYTNTSPTSQTITGNNQYKQYTFDFTGKFTGVDPTKITQVSFFFNPGSSYSGTVYFDDLIVGDQILVTPLSISVNQIGYELNGPKTAIVQTSYVLSDTMGFSVVNDAGKVVFKGQAGPTQQVTGWQNRNFRVIDFSGLATSGNYKLSVKGNLSNPFTIGKDLLFSKTANSVVSFFNGMRSNNTLDNSLPFHDATRTDKANVLGGWKDATGDPGKHMSHLSYAFYFNPQQIPFVTWTLMKSYEWCKTPYGTNGAAVLAEAAFGADYLVKNVDAAGYLYLSVFDDWGGTPNNREICEWGVPDPGNDPNFNKTRTSNYQAAMREGAGMAIAALAKAYRSNLTVGTNTPSVYLANAEKLYAHLKSPGNGYATKNLEYCNDHHENLIDFYCGLMASTELYKATQKALYLQDALSFSQKLLNQQSADGWLASDSAHNRPSYHAADEGLPLLALSEYVPIASNKTSVLAFMNKWIKWQYSIATEVANPYLYPRQYYKAYSNKTLQPAQKAFFIPHLNETSYWWQGENARLASLATGWIVAGRILKQSYTISNDSLSKMAFSSLDWVVGKNPFDVCMMTGFGTTNYPGYVGKTNIVGGICNGITSDVDTETDIAWMPYSQTDASVSYQNWRWIEQWLPHDAWFLMAISAISNNVNNPVSDCIGVENGNAFVDSCGKCTGGTTGIVPIFDKLKCGSTGINGIEDEWEVNGLSLYPNPSKGMVTISTVQHGHFQLKVIQLNGVEIWNGQSETGEYSLDVSSFPAGLYNAIITYDNQVKFVKFAVMK
jgi:hypothetical protein